MDKQNKGEKQPNQRVKASDYLVVSIDWLHCILFPNRSQRCRLFIKAQQKELRQLLRGEENLKTFFTDMWRLVRDSLIPTPTNNFKPTALRPKPLAAYAVIGIAVKVFATGVLFFFYPTPAYLSSIVASRMVALVNQSREGDSLPALTVNGALIDAALAKGNDMFEQQYFAHDSPDGKKPWQWINRSQYDYLYAGENLAIDFSSAEVAHNAFMNSTSHRRNVLLPQYQDIGVAVLTGNMKGRETILVVNFFGAQEAQKAPEPVKVELPAVVAEPTTPTVAVVSQPTPTPVPAPAPAPTPVPTPTPTPAPVTPAPQPVVPTPITPTPVPTPAPTPVPTTVATITPTPAAQPVALGVETSEGDSEPFNVDPEPLYKGYSTQGAIVVSANTLTQRSGMDLVIKFTHVFFGAFLLFMSVALFLNIIIKIRIQHASVVLQSVAVIALMAALLFSQLHFAESIPHELLIL